MNIKLDKIVHERQKKIFSPADRREQELKNMHFTSYGYDRDEPVVNRKFLEMPETE